ncbi:ABC transporter substrate-binding protein [Cyanobium sp. T1B-Tous]|nr:ABC transporter substrate-binding protein [Cyanobium sp. T1B-Tous]
MAGCSPRRHEVSVPVSSWPGYEYFFLAQQKGLAERYNLKLTTAQFSDPQEIVHAYLRGEIPMAQLTTVELVDICGRAPERCPEVVLILDESRGADLLAARRDVGSVKALAGKTIGMTFSTLGPYFVSRALQRSGLTLDQVVIRNMPLAEMSEALAKGHVDAVAFFPPFSDAALRAGHSRVLFDSRQIPGEIFDVLVVESAYLKQNFHAIMKLLKTWQDAHRYAHRYARAHAPEAAVVMARRQNVSVEEFQAAERGLVYFSLAEQRALLAPGGLMERNLKAVQQVQQRLKLVRPDAPLPQVNAALVQEALR